MAEEDVISSLPECLLLEIISRLPTTKHAIRTSTLSKRWQHLWTLLPNLIFVESEFVCPRWINKTLNQCPTHAKLNKFELRLNITSQHFGITFYKSSINRWIRYAITRNVQEVNIELRDGGNLGKFRYDDDYFFMNLCATQMKLTSCVFIKPIGAISRKNLKCLCISDGILDEDVIADILSGSPCLETLELDNSYGFSLINVTSKSVKNLVFSNYDYSTYCKQDNVITINAPYILSLTIRCTMDLREILFLNVSSLVKADLVYWPSVSLFGLDEEQQEELLKGLLHCLGHVKTITLGESTTEVLSRLVAKGFQFFEEANDID